MVLLAYNDKFSITVFQKRLCTYSNRSKCRICTFRTQHTLVNHIAWLQTRFNIKPPVRNFSQKIESHHAFFFKIRHDWRDSPLKGNTEGCKLKHFKKIPKKSTTCQARRANSPQN